MTQKLQDKLISNYKKYFKYFYLEEEIEEPIKNGILCGDGWYDLIEDMLDVINKHLNKKIIYFQIKGIYEKFGRLTIEYSGGDEFVKGAITMTQKSSYKICEFCGSTQKVLLNTEKGKTMCEKCTINNRYE